MAKNRTNNTINSDISNWTIKIIGNMAFVWSAFIQAYNLNWAKSWDKVKLEKVASNPNIPEYKVVKIIKEQNTTNDILNKITSQTQEILTWTYKELNEKGWFIKISGQTEEVFVKKNNSLNAKNGDKVSLTIIKLGDKVEALVNEILQKQKIYKFAVFSDWKILLEAKKEIKVSNLKSFNLENWDVFSIEQEESGAFTINQKLHPKWKNSFEELKIVLVTWVEIEFSAEVLTEVDAISETIEEAEIARRLDLRNLYTITIDWPDTKDIDDAISVESLPNWEYKLYVHIADVSHYIRPWMLTWEEAKKRWTSIYFMDKVIPMIPEKLSNGLCSLNPNENKLAMTCEVIIDKYGNLDFTRAKVYESVINSNARTTYKEVQDIFEDKKLVWDKLEFTLNPIDENLVNTVKNAFGLSRSLNNKRAGEWELVFSNREIKISLDDTRKPEWFKKYDFYESNDLIKALMVAANETVANIYGSGPFLHRTHAKPKEEKIELLKTTMTYLEIDLEWLDINIWNMQKLLKLVQWHPKEKTLNMLILRTLQLAKVTDKLEWHHGLALQKWYSWFTSPIRRFPDTQIHLIIKETNAGTINKEEYNEVLLKIAEDCTLLEQRADLLYIILGRQNWKNFWFYNNDYKWKSNSSRAWFMKYKLKSCYR